MENILSVFIAFWKRQRSWGPRTENILQFTLLALAEANLRRIERDGDDFGAEEQYTLLDVIPLLQKVGFRHMVLEEVRDPVTLDWFTNYYDPLRQGFRDEMISSIINKISKYAAAKVSRRLLGQSRATVRLADDIRAGRAILVNTASGIVGEEVSALVGAMLVGLFQTALAEQIRRTKAERRAFWIVIDEFQTYLGIDYNTMLAELRKYGGAFALATQSLSYPEESEASSQQPEPERRRGGRGKRGGKRGGKDAERDRTRRTAEGDLLSQPAVLTESERAQPRTRVWHREDPEREESGEMGGE